MTLHEELFSMQDVEYREFHAKLMPNIDKRKIIGIRTPDLRKFASQFAGREEADTFLQILPHDYYEENNLHAFLIEKIKDYDTAIYETERFLHYIDNWATCDMFLPPVFKRKKDKLIVQINKWLKAEETYTKRYAIGLLMKLYLDKDFKAEYMDSIAEVSSDEYYIKMMVAWYFATALAKQYDYAVKILAEKRLDVWTHNKAIQKAVESKRILPNTKDYLRTLKRKV